MKFVNNLIKRVGLKFNNTYLRKITQLKHIYYMYKDIF